MAYDENTSTLTTVHFGIYGSTGAKILELLRKRLSKYQPSYNTYWNVLTVDWAYRTFTRWKRENTGEVVLRYGSELGKVYVYHPHRYYKEYLPDLENADGNPESAKCVLARILNRLLREIESPEQSNEYVAINGGKANRDSLHGAKACEISLLVRFLRGENDLDKKYPESVWKRVVGAPRDPVKTEIISVTKAEVDRIHEEFKVKFSEIESVRVKLVDEAKRRMWTLMRQAENQYNEEARRIADKTRAERAELARQERAAVGALKKSMRAVG